MGWYYTKEKKRYGPVTEAELLALIQVGDLGPREFVWRPGLDLWSRAGDLAELFPPPPLPPEDPTPNHSSPSSARPGVPVTFAPIAPTDQRQPEPLVQDQANVVHSPVPIVLPAVSHGGNTLPGDLQTPSLGLTPSFDNDMPLPTPRLGAWLYLGLALFSLSIGALLPVGDKATPSRSTGEFIAFFTAIGLFRRNSFLRWSANAWRKWAMVQPARDRGLRWMVPALLSTNAPWFDDNGSCGGPVPWRSRHPCRPPSANLAGRCRCFMLCPWSARSLCRHSGNLALSGCGRRCRNSQARHGGAHLCGPKVGGRGSLEWRMGSTAN